MKSKCNICGKEGELKIGWDNADYCSEDHEVIGVGELHASMPGGRVPGKPHWMPRHVRNEISRRWEE
jgi:hypothetical protein